MTNNPALDAVLGTNPPKTWGEMTDSFIAIIDSDPRRVRMNGYRLYGDEVTSYSHAGMPECGTVGCYLGWGGVMLNMLGGELSLKLTAIHEPWSEALWEACYFMPPGTSGTRHYADLVLERFRKVRKEFRAEMDAANIVTTN